MDDHGNTESSYFPITEPEEQKQERREEKGQVKESLALIEKMIARFDKRIAFYDSLNSVTPDVSTSAEEHLRACIAGQATKQNLEAEREYLTQLRDTHK